ncbi:MAG: DUF5320 domain-containing protein, partial [Sphaerochaetaceae bacterium]
IMPRGDGTGRFGYGPMSGRGFGYCAGYGRPGYMQGGRGFGMGYGRGFGQPYGVEPINEREALTLQAKDLERQLEYIKGRLELLEGRHEG